MPLSEGQVIIAVFVMTGITFLTRALPFWLFSGNRRPSATLRYISKYLPPAIIAMLVVYCFRNVPVSAWPFGLPELIGTASVIVLHLWKRNDILSIFGGTAIYMLMVQVVFA